MDEDELTPEHDNLRELLASLPPGEARRFLRLADNPPFDGPVAPKELDPTQPSGGGLNIPRDEGDKSMTAVAGKPD